MVVFEINCVFQDVSYRIGNTMQYDLGKAPYKRNILYVRISWDENEIAFDIFSYVDINCNSR